MNGLGVGSVIAKEAKRGMFLDPLREEEEGAEGVVSLGVMPALGRVTGVWMVGELEVGEACQVSSTRS